MFSIVLTGSSLYSHDLDVRPNKYIGLNFVEYFGLSKDFFGLLEIFIYNKSSSLKYTLFVRRHL